MQRILVAVLFLLVSIPCLSIPPLESRSSGFDFGDSEFVLSLRSIHIDDHAGGFGIRGGVIRATNKTGLGISMLVEYNSIAGDNNPVTGTRYPINGDTADIEMDWAYWTTTLKSLDFLFGAELSLRSLTNSLPFDLLINADAGFGVGSETSDEYYFDYWDGELVEIVEGPNEFAVGLIYRFGIEGRFAISDNMVVGLGYKWEHSAWAGGDIKLSPNSLEASIRFR